MAKVIEITQKDLKRAERRAAFREAKEKAFQKVKEFGDRCNDNKEIIMISVPAAVTGVKAILKFANKHVTVKKEEELKDLYCYDRSLGHYWRLRKELTNREWLEIESRKKNGERLSDILDDLKVLK